MVLVFILCTIIIFITLLICIVLLSTIRLRVDDFEASNLNKREQNRPKSEYRVILSLYLLNKIKWLAIHVNSKKMRKMYSKLKLEEMDIKKIEQNIKLEDIKEIKKIKPKISYLNLDAKIGTEDAILTSFVVFAISTILAILLPYTMKKYQKGKYQYEIMPLYYNQNLYEIKFNCIIEVKMVHIINIIYFFSSRKLHKQFS